MAEGQSWTMLPVNDNFIFAQAVRSDDEIFVSGGGVFGRLVKQADGQFRYESLMEQVTDAPSEFAAGGSLVVHDDAVWVSSGRFFFRWHDGDVQHFAWPELGRGCIGGMVTPGCCLAMQRC